jgi:ubiquinone/menaquinone biosynthesis C-methylase UbiE
MRDTESVRKVYDRIAADYDRRWRPYIEVTLARIIEAASFDGREKVLDAPCGTGELEQRLLAAWPDLHVTGVDLSPAMLRCATQKEGLGSVSWIVADVSRLPLPDGEFDVVVCANSFHYFRAPEISLREIRRVLRRNGVFILVDWCDDYLTCKLCSLWLRWTHPAFYRTYSLRTCTSLLERSGFEVQDAEQFRVNWLWGMMRIVSRRAE